MCSINIHRPFAEEVEIAKIQVSSAALTLSSPYLILGLRQAVSKAGPSMNGA
jgi:hypothetical protein